MDDSSSAEEVVELRIDKFSAVIGDYRFEFVTGGVLSHGEKIGKKRKAVQLTRHGVDKAVLGMAVYYLEEIFVSSLRCRSNWPA